MRKERENRWLDEENEKSERRDECHDKDSKGALRHPWKDAGWDKGVLKHP
jgi:hypothetical protein